MDGDYRGLYTRVRLCLSDDGPWVGCGSLGGCDYYCSIHEAQATLRRIEESVQAEIAAQQRPASPMLGAAGGGGSFGGSFGPGMGAGLMGGPGMMAGGGFR